MENSRGSNDRSNWREIFKKPKKIDLSKYSIPSPRTKKKGDLEAQNAWEGGVVNPSNNTTSERDISPPAEEDVSPPGQPKHTLKSKLASEEQSKEHSRVLSTNRQSKFSTSIKHIFGPPEHLKPSDGEKKKSWFGEKGPTRTDTFFGLFQTMENATDTDGTDGDSVGSRKQLIKERSVRDQKLDSKGAMVASLAAQAMLYKHRYKKMKDEMETKQQNTGEEEIARSYRMKSLKTQKEELEQQQRIQQEQILDLEQTIALLQSEQGSTKMSKHGSTRIVQAMNEFGKGSRKTLVAEFFKEGFDMGRNVLWRLVLMATDAEGEICGCLPVGENFSETFKRWFDMLLILSFWDETSPISIQTKNLIDFLSQPPSIDPQESWCNPCYFMLWLLKWPFAGLALILVNLVRIFFSLPFYVLILAVGVVFGVIWLVYSIFATSAYIAFVYMFDLRELIHTHQFQEPLFSFTQIVDLLRNFRNRVTLMWVVWHLMDALTDFFFAVKLAGLYPTLSFFAFFSIIMSMSARFAIGTYLRLHLRLEKNKLDKRISPLVSCIVSVVAPSAIVELHEILTMEKATLGSTEQERLEISCMTYFGLIAEVVMEHFPAAMIQSYYYAWHHSFTAFDLFNTSLTFLACITVFIVLVTGTTFFSGSKSLQTRVLEILGAVLGFPLPLLTTTFIGLLFIISVVWDFLIGTLTILSHLLLFSCWLIAHILIFGFFHDPTKIIFQDWWFHSTNFWKTLNFWNFKFIHVYDGRRRSFIVS